MPQFDECIPNRRIPNGTYGGVGGRGLTTPSYPIFQLTGSVLFARIEFVVAIAAINGFAVAGFKRDLACFTTIGADRGEHLAGSAVIATTTGPAIIAATTTPISLLLFSRRSASHAPLGFVGIAPLRE
jgi:hypothetical protein